MNDDDGGRAIVPEGKVVACLDIGKSMTHIMVGRLGEKGSEPQVIKAFLAPSSGYNKGTLVDGWQLTEAIRHAVKRAEDELDESIAGFYLGVDAELTNLREVQALTHFASPTHMITQDDTLALLKKLHDTEEVSTSQYIDIFPVIFSLDNDRTTREPEGQQSSFLSVRGFMMQRRSDYLLQILRCIKYARIKIDGLIHVGLAVGEVFLSEEERLSETIILDMGAESCKFYCFRAGFMQAELYLPFGGRTFSQDIETVLKCKAVIAEQLKYLYGFSFSAPYLLDETTDQQGDHSDETPNYEGLVKDQIVPEILQARLDDILRLAMLNLSSDGISSQKCILKLMGGEASVNGLENYLRASWDSEVDLIHPPLSYVALPAFTGVYAMLYYLQHI